LGITRFGATTAGTVFKITPTGTLTTLNGIDGTFAEGNATLSQSALVQATDGNFYGTAADGGANGQGGTVFKITPSGTLTTLYSFCSQTNCTDGVEPDAGVVQATNGNFYGTTSYGGAFAACGQPGCGTVFEITPTGTLTTLYSFCSQGFPCPDGFLPRGGLIQAADGNFYGTTEFGGAIGFGTVFKITPSGTLTTLYSFGSQGNGREPAGALVQATDGYFYGTTLTGGAIGLGTVFKITPSGTLTTLYSFCSQSGCADGLFASAALVQATDGNFYGTTVAGGANLFGTVFSLSAGLVPSTPTVISISPTSAIAGGAGFTLTVNGTNFVSGSTVNLNGNARATTFVSAAQLTAAILASDIATAGTFNVTVINPGGGTSHAVTFTVR
jgi:uncharacterized repeat protein (TIGR03803 family)